MQPLVTNFLTPLFASLSLFLTHTLPYVQQFQKRSIHTSESFGMMDSTKRLEKTESSKKGHRMKKRETKSFAISEMTKRK